jgi:transmembrane sensor
MSGAFSDKDQEWQEWMDAYLSGTADDATLQRLQHWTAESDGNRQLFLAMLKSHKIDIPEWVEEVDVAEHWAEMRERMGTPPVPVLPEERPERYFRRGITAVIAVVIFGCFLLLQLSRPVYQQFEAVSTPMPLTLPDSTRILINVHSSVRFKQGFGQGHRQLEQSGQVYYEVTPNENLPFIVKTDWSVTTVLGTSFDLQAYPGNPKEQLSVLSGSVQYAPMADVAMQHIITSGNSATYNKTKPEVMVSNSLISTQLYWSGRVVFDSDQDSVVTDDNGK